MNIIKYLSRFLIIGILLISAACSDDDDPVVIVPTSEDAAFTYSFDEENPNKVIFKANTEIETWYTHWSFGDNTSAEGFEASKIFLKKGDYDVRFKIFTDGGVAESIQTVVINEDFQGPNVLVNGEFNGSDPWVVLPISDGVNVSFDDNNAQWTGGGWGQVGIYQPFNVLADNLYQLTMDIKLSGLTDSWFEVYIGTEVPVPGQDYADGGMRLALNTWEGCGSEPFEGEFSEISCKGSGATFEFPTAGTVYLVIRGGGADYGAQGVIIDNVAVRSLESTVLPPPYAPSPVADFTVETSDLTATFTNTSTNATSYTWDFGDGTGTSTNENPSYTYTEGGTYTVKLTASNDTKSVETTQEVTVINPASAPVANFTVETSGLTATFTNTSTNGTSYTWDFGDGTGSSTDENPAYTYAADGTYTVKLTATNNTGSNEYTEEVSVVSPVDENLVTNGTFDDASGWTITNHYEAANTNGIVTIADGVAKFDETTSSDWKHMGIYTSVELEVGTYQFEMDMTYADINDVWGEVYIGATEPVQHEDYGGDQQVLKAYNAWDCSTIKTYSGLATESGCDESENPGQFEITTAGTYYLLFRTGGATYGTQGIVIDNVSLLKVN